MVQVCKGTTKISFSIAALTEKPKRKMFSNRVSKCTSKDHQVETIQLGQPNPRLLQTYAIQASLIKTKMKWVGQMTNTNLIPT